MSGYSRRLLITLVVAVWLVPSCAPAFAGAITRSPAALSGHRAGPVSFSSLAGARYGPLGIKYNSSFDLRSLGKVSSVKSQSPYQTCWTFAALGSLESCLLPVESWDFSEENLAWYNGFDFARPGGGNAFMATAQLTRWDAPFTEVQDPYADNVHPDPSTMTVQKHVQDVMFLPPRASAADNDNIKWALTTYGAVDVDMYADDSMVDSTTSTYWNESTHSYRYTGSSGANHDVLIVGWNDNYPRTSFSSQPAGDGAFLVKNSWGSSWGNAGYFWASYYDSRIGYGGFNAVFMGAEPTSVYTHIYQWDPLGWTLRKTLAYTADSTAWAANTFVADGDAQVKAIGFYTLGPNASYEVFAGPSLTSLTPRGSGALTWFGFHTVDFSSPMTVADGQPFIVAVRITTPDYGGQAIDPVAIEGPKAGYSSGATATSGQSYVSHDGSTWTDLTTVTGYGNCNVCVKAYTAAAAAVAPAVTSPNGGEDWPLGSSHAITWSTGSGGNVTIELSRNSGASWETLFSSTANDGSESWTVSGPVANQALVRISNATGSDDSNAAFAIAAAPSDTTPPTVSVSGYDDAWHNHAVVLALSASDNESGVHCIWWSRNQEPDWYQLLGSTGQITVPAPADHSWDGDNQIWYCGEDNAGNTPDTVTTHCHVKIDTRPPTAVAPAGASVRRGKTVKLLYKISDATPNGGTAETWMSIRTLKGRTVKAFHWTKDLVNQLYSVRFRCTLARGTYRFYVSATDAAGNAQASVGVNKLIVR